MAEAKIVQTKIDIATLEMRVSGIENGAICTFAGQVRNHSRGKQVAFLEYDAYIPMAEKQMLKIAQEAEAKWGCEVVIEHRIGRIELGEASVVIVVGSPHRAQAFEACRWCIDTLKEDVPVWKRETCPDGSFWIEGETSVLAKEEPAEKLTAVGEGSESPTVKIGSPLE